MRSSSRRTRSNLTRRKTDAQDQDRDCCDAEGLMRVLVALGGNALQKRGEPMTVAHQRPNRAAACGALAPVALEHELVISHGNGPQVGLLALQASAFDEVSSYPFDVLGAQTEGMIGYLIEQELGNLLPFEKPLATILTMTEVDPGDPAFEDPTKFVGPVYSRDEALRLAAERGWGGRPDGGAWGGGVPWPGAGRLGGRGAGCAPGAVLCSAREVAASRPCIGPGRRHWSVWRRLSTRTARAACLPNTFMPTPASSPPTPTPSI